MAKIRVTSLLFLLIFIDYNSCNNSSATTHKSNMTPSFNNCSTPLLNTSNITRPQRATSSIHITCTIPVSTLNLSYSIFLVVVMIVAFFGNVFVCLVIMKSRKLRSQSVFHLLFSLAVSDILVSLLSLPVKLHMGLHNQQFCMAETFCWFYYYSDIFANCSSVTHLLLISLQRFIAMMYPFENHIILSRQRIDSLIGLVWAYSAVWSLLCTFSWDEPTSLAVRLYESPTIRTCLNNNPVYWTSVYVAVFIIPLFLMGCLQAAILNSVKSHTKRLLKLERDSDRAVRMRKREIRVAKTVSIVYAAFTICWLPVCLITVSSSWCRQCFFRFKKWNNDLFVATFLIFTNMLPPLSSTLNPFIYVISGDEFRKAIKGVLRKQTRSKNSTMTKFTQHSVDHRNSWV